MYHIDHIRTMTIPNKSTDIFSYFLRLASYHIWRQNVFNSRGRSLSKSKPTLLGLDDYCLANVYRYLDLRDLASCRQVCTTLHKSVDNYLDVKKQLKYTCNLNGIKLCHGQYQFNESAFHFALQHMPNLESLSFERCSTMNFTLATCQTNLIDMIASHLYNLKELHISRSLAINERSIQQLVQAFPQLTHLTVTIFNENILETIVDGFTSLQYLNLDNSVLSAYQPIMKRVGPNFKTFIAPDDYKNKKFELLDALCQGNGKNLERLELAINITDLEQDAKFFTKLGKNLTKLTWFKCDMKCVSKVTTKNTDSPLRDRTHSLSHHELDYEYRRPPSVTDSDLQLSYEHRHLSLVQGLSGLANLRVLILVEKDYFDIEDRCSLLNDDSLLDIFKSCNQLEMLTISCALRCHSKNYRKSNLNNYVVCQKINHLLNSGCQNTRDSLSSPSEVFDSQPSALKRKVLLEENNNCLEVDGNENLFGSLFKCDSDVDVQSLDSGISDNVQFTHKVSDTALSTIDFYLPKLRILALRGVRLGSHTLEAIVNLTKLQHLSLDSISFNTNELNIRHRFNQFILKLTKSISSNVDLQFSNIPL